MIKVEIVWGNSQSQQLIDIDLPDAAIIKDALQHPHVTKNLQLGLINTLQLGIFSKKASLLSPLRSGDRIEIYRPLKINPKEARRLRATHNKR